MSHVDSTTDVGDPTDQLGERWAVVTGSAGGIGSAVVRRLQKDGIRVLGVDRSDDGLSDEHLRIDLARAEVGRAVAERMGDRRVVALVNNGAESSSRPTEGLETAEWDQILAANLRAPFLLAEALVPALHANDGAVVNVGSIHAYATSVGAVPYAASKGGLLALTRALAVDWATRGINVRINAVAPAAIDAPMLTDGLVRTGQTLDEIGRRHPIGRVGTSEEVAGTVVFLLSPDAGFAHGTTIVLDGGALARLSTE